MTAITKSQTPELLPQSSGSTSVVSQIKNAMKLQENRAQEYSKFEKEFRRLLHEEIADQDYMEICQLFMSQLQTINKDMISIIKNFKTRNITKIARLISNLQKLEKNKLKLTVDMQQKILLARPKSTEISSTNAQSHECCNTFNSSSAIMNELKKHNLMSNSFAVKSQKMKNMNHNIWRPRLYKEKQEMAVLIENINDILAELKEIQNDLHLPQVIRIQGNMITIETNDDCKKQFIKEK